MRARKLLRSFIFIAMWISSVTGKHIMPPVSSLDSTPHCTNNLQAAIGFHTDISSVPRASEFRAKAQLIFQSIIKNFDVPLTHIDINDNTCEFDRSQEENKSLFYGSIYANSSSIINPTFCQSNMDWYPTNVGTANYKQADQVTLQSVINSYTKWYNGDVKMKCHCFDYQNADTTKIIVWTPLSPTSLDTGKVSFDGFKLAGFQHVVMPFGFNYQDSELWRSLVPDPAMWLTDASRSDYTVGAVIQDISTIICRCAGREADQTSTPSNPQILFIQDVCGKNKNLMDAAQSVYANYASLLKSTDIIYLGTNNPHLSEVVVVSTIGDLIRAMNANRAAAVTCTTPSIGSSLDSFYQKLKREIPSSNNDHYHGTANVAHVTSVGVDPGIGSNLGNLEFEFSLTMEFIGIKEQNSYFMNAESFDIFPGEFTQTYDPEIALLDLVNTFGPCQHGNLTGAGYCACDPFYGGDYCTDFLCNNGILVDDICSCYTGYAGDYCEEKADPRDRWGIAYLLIQDICGDDDKLKDSAQGVLSDYMALFKTFDNFYLGTNSPDQSDVVLVKSVGELTTAMNANRVATANCANPSLGGIIDSFYQELRQPALVSSFMFATASDPVVGSARVAHVTTVGVDSNTGMDLKNLSIDFILAMEFIGITDKNVYFSDPDAFNAFPGDFTETYDPEVALLDLVNTFGSDRIPSIPPPDSITSRCIKNLQAAIGFHTDISSVPGASDYRAKAQKIFQSVTKFFDVPASTIDIDDETCEFDKSQEENKSLFYGSVYCNSSSVINPTFCMSNMDSFPANVGTANYKQSDQVTLQSVIDSYTKWFNADCKMLCHCFDYLNPDTTKIIMWVPLSPTSLDKGAVNFNGFNLAGFKHIVMPFGFDYDDSPVWRSLVPDRDMWITDASKANYDVEKIIQDIWTLICRIAGRIEEDQTAEPYNPYTTKKPKTGVNIEINDDSFDVEAPN